MNRSICAIKVEVEQMARQLKARSYKINSKKIWMFVQFTDIPLYINISYSVSLFIIHVRNMCIFVRQPARHILYFERV